MKYKVKDLQTKEVHTAQTSGFVKFRFEHGETLIIFDKDKDSGIVNMKVFSETDTLTSALLEHTNAKKMCEDRGGVVVDKEISTFPSRIEVRGWFSIKIEED